MLQNLIKSALPRNSRLAAQVYSKMSSWRLKSSQLTPQLPDDLKVTRSLQWDDVSRVNASRDT